MPSGRGPAPGDAAVVRRGRLRQHNVVIMLLFALMTLYPLWYVLINSLNEGRDAALGGIWFIPRKWSLNNYTFVFNDTMRNAYIITISSKCPARIRLGLGVGGVDDPLEPAAALLRS